MKQSSTYTCSNNANQPNWTPLFNCPVGQLLQFDFFDTTSKPASKFCFTEAEKKKSLGLPLLSDFKKDLKVKEVFLAPGVPVNITCLTNFKGMQKEEMIKLFRCMNQAAKELGLTYTLSEVGRSVSVSNRARVKKPSLVAPGGKSPHNYGAAVDFCLFCDGKSVVATSTIQKKFVARVIKLSNDTVVWGGDYKKDCNGPRLPGTGEEHHLELKNWEEKYKNSKNLIK